MPAPVRPLPVLQNWDCHGCGNCCREYQIAVSDDERRRIEGQGWDQDAEIGGLPLFRKQGAWWGRRYRLNHRPDGACVFLSAEGRCRIHERFGPSAKPLACRLYPFVLTPAGDHWRVGLRFACPSAAANLGRPLAEHRADLEHLAPELERQAGVAPGGRPPPLQPGQRADWHDALRFVQALLALLRDPGERFERRMRKCLVLAALCRQARFDRVTGGRLVEFLNLVGAALEDEAPADPAAVPEPGWVARVLFRQAAALYVRKDHGPDRSRVRSRTGLLAAGWRFARGRGPVPPVHGKLAATTFERMEEPAGALPPAAEQVLERYYLTKVGSLQFWGPTNFGMPLWEGFEALALTLPVILWASRGVGPLPREEAVAAAVGMVDNNFGFNRLLGTRRQRVALGILARRRDIEKLIAWYGR